MHKKIIVVTSDKLTASMVSEGLIGSYDVILAEDEVAAVELVSERHPDLLIIDLDLYVSSGIEIVSSLREWSSIPVFFLTSTYENLIKFDYTDYYNKLDEKITLREKVSEFFKKTISHP